MTALILKGTSQENSQVRIRLLDASGRLVEGLLNSELPLGSHEMPYDISSRQPGVYLIQMETTSPSGVQISRTRIILSQ